MVWQRLLITSRGVDCGWLAASTVSRLLFFSSGSDTTEGDTAAVCGAKCTTPRITGDPPNLSKC
jgi:hypothetical protein